jgi:hypothetical protein
MATLTYQKTVNASYLVGVACVIAMPDALFGLLLELVHYLFEIFESTLDHMVEHIFHTGTLETQIIVFYLMLAMAFGGLYCLWRAMPRFLRNLKENLCAAIVQRKTRLLRYWAGPASNKFKLVAGFNAALTFVVLFGF